MNNELINQLPPDEQPVALKLSSAAETMKLSPNFQWNLETQLMDFYKSKNDDLQQSLLVKFMAPIAWGIVAVFGILLLSWALRSLLPNLQVAAGPTATQELSFEASVRTGNICTGPLAIEHDFAVFLSNPQKTGFVMLDPGKMIGELRSFAWSANGRQLAILGNTTGRGNLYLTDASGSQLQPVLSSSELGYLFDAAWSRDGRQFVAWSVQNNNMIYLIQADGSSVVEKQLDVQILGTPQFAPDGKSIIFYGADSTSAGLFEVRLDDSHARILSPLVEDETGFGFSPDGSHLAYVEMDRNLGEARLIVQEIATTGKTVLGTLSIPKGSGSSLPESANLSWSSDGKLLVFDFGRGANDRSIYLAQAEGTGLVKAVDSAYTPSISADGKCLAYISNQKVFLLNLTNTSSEPILLADLPSGRGISNFKLDKLQWKP